MAMILGLSLIYLSAAAGFYSYLVSTAVLVPAEQEDRSPQS